MKINQKVKMWLEKIKQKKALKDNRRETKRKCKRRINKSLITLIIIDVFVAICFFLTYGPISYFRDFLITTAMTTQSHKYLARIFYDDETINKVLSQNFIYNFAEGSDATQVVIGGIDEDINYASSYEKEILEREEGQEYKFISFKYNGYNCFLVAIYDPTRVSLMQSKYIGREGQILTDMSKTYGAKVAINAGGFADISATGIVGEGNGGKPSGIVIKDNKLVFGNGNVNTEIAGFNNDGILVLSYSTANQAIANGIKDAVQFGPFLVVNGVSASISGNGGWGINPRTVLAQRKDGIVLFLVVDGNGANNYNWSGRGGASMSDLLVILERYGAYNAVNMDGGASTTLVIENKLINSPCGYNSYYQHQRRLPNAWMFK